MTNPFFVVTLNLTSAILIIYYRIHDEQELSIT